MSRTRHRLSASSRVLLAMTGMLATSLALLVVVGYAVTARTLTSAVDATLLQESQAYSAAMQSAPVGDALDAATRAYFQGRTGGSAGVVPILLVRLNSGRVLSNSELRLEDADGNGGRSAARASFRTVEFRGSTYRVLSVPIQTRGSRAGVFEAALARQPAQQTAARVALTLSAAALIALAVGLLLSFWATRRALAPLTQMAEDAARITDAHLGQRIEYAGPADELGSLAESLNQMLERLEEAFGEQRRFVADASHELRTPVAVVRGNVELLLSGAAAGESASESLQMIETESVRMTRLLDELLSLARLEATGAVQFQPLEVAILLDEVAGRTRALGDREIVREGPCNVWIEGDPDLLDQALVNLARNAVAHTTEGGRITLSCSPSADTVCIEVSDDGPGITAGDLDRLFDRFFRAPGQTRDDVTGGSGLGLAITKRLVDLHGGTIHAENVEPHGARFVITLPRIDEPPPL